MAEKKKKAPRKFTKEYQGGRRKLKDVDKSGKRDFGDTFLGDLIGADKGGKLGVQGAGLKASLKGERREKDAKPKRKVSSPIKKTSSGIIKGDFTRKDDIEVTKLPPKVKYGPPGSARPDPKKPDAKPKPAPDSKPSTTAERQREAFKKYTSKQWENMSKEERKENDLPPTIVALGAGKYRNFKFKDGTSPLDFSRQLKRMLNMNEGGSVSKKKKGYAKGGMSKKGVMSYNMGGMVKSQVNNLKKAKR
jgi:hypothetical protein